MDCPRCGTQLVAGGYHSIQLDFCGGCGGAWFDAGELRQVHGLAEDLSGERGLDLDDAARIRCPSCSGLMESRWFSPSCRTLVDHCPTCHGVWLDRDEMKAILREVYGVG